MAKKPAEEFSDKRTSGKGPIKAVSTRRKFLSGDSFTVTVTGGNRTSRTEFIGALDLAVKLLIADEESAHTKKGRASRKAPTSLRK